MRLPVPHKKGENNGPVAHVFKAQYTVCGNILAIDVQTFLPYCFKKELDHILGSMFCDADQNS